VSDGGDLTRVLGQAFGALDEVLGEPRASLDPIEVGTISYIGQGIARVAGLPHVKSEELLVLPGDLVGMAFTLEGDEVGVILLGESDHVRAGDEVRRTGRVMDVPVGEAILGRVVDATGRPLDGKGPVRTWERAPIERDAAPIMHRAPVTVPLQTGLKVVDALIPVGRGQRELIMGDRQTGKTAVALDTIINQADKDVICIYCAISQRSSATARVLGELQERGAMRYCAVVVAGGEDPPGLQFIAPYAATTMAEYFMHKGRDVLVIYDDLTRHAVAYREVSLLLRRPPGREAFPGDIFYIHSRLLERATHLRPDYGGGSLTALPVVETEAENVSAYIPTNLISITDGQIYLSPVMFRKGLLPAVDVGTSVSRVGGKAQLPAFRAVAGDLRLAFTQFEELEVFARFGTRLDDATRQTLERGRRVREVLRQPQFAPISVEEQIAVLAAVTRGAFDGIPAAEVPRAAGKVAVAVTRELPAVCELIRTGGKLGDNELDEIESVARRTVNLQDSEADDADN